jgi:ribosomal protein S18 acetylase RimI-like enzyme
MSSTDPWITLGRDFDSSLKVVSDPSREVYVAEDEAGIAGLIVLSMTGVLTGYIQTVLVAPDRQGKGIGSQLVAFAEERIFKDSPNAFCACRRSIQMRFDCMSDWVIGTSESSRIS